MEKIKNILSKIWEILKKVLSHYIVINLLIFTILCLIIYWGTFKALHIYTDHGKVIPVPNVIGEPLEEAGKILQSHNLRWHLSDSVYVADVNPGAVAYQYPETGSDAKKNRNVFLVIRAISPEMVRMPNVVGVSLRHAKTILEQHNLTLGRTNYVTFYARDYVLKQFYQGKEIENGTMIVKGSAIVLVLGDGKGKFEEDEEDEIKEVVNEQE